MGFIFGRFFCDFSSFFLIEKMPWYEKTILISKGELRISLLISIFLDFSSIFALIPTKNATVLLSHIHFTHIAVFHLPNCCDVTYI